MNLARGRFLCPLDPDWNMKGLERRILRKVQEKRWRKDDREEATRLQGNREVTM
jgi:hypothetical protein